MVTDWRGRKGSKPSPTEWTLAPTSLLHSSSGLPCRALDTQQGTVKAPLHLEQGLPNRGTWLHRGMACHSLRTGAQHATAWGIFESHIYSRLTSNFCPLSRLLLVLLMTAWATWGLQLQCQDKLGSTKVTVKKCGTRQCLTSEIWRGITPWRYRSDTQNIFHRSELLQVHRH